VAAAGSSAKLGLLVKRGREKEDVREEEEEEGRTEDRRTREATERIIAILGKGNTRIDRPNKVVRFFSDGLLLRQGAGL